jgi:tetratricopeptide (TPR) repeat protein
MMPVDLNAALEEHRRGHIERAALVYQTALAEDPDHPDALHLLGVVAIQQGDPNQAALLIGRAAALRPDDAAIHANLGEVYRLLGDNDRTIDCCRAALRVQPNYPEVHSNLGLALVRRGDRDEAIGHFREAIRLKPGFAAAHYSLGEALWCNGDKASALEQFRRVVLLDPASAEARCNLGRALMEQGAPHQALIHCQEAVRLRPDMAAAHNNLGNALQLLGRLDEAKVCLLEALRLEPDQTASYVSLANVWEQLGEFDQALDSLRDVLRRDPHHAGALARLAMRLRDQLPDAEQATIDSLLTDPKLSLESRLQLQFGLAQVLDARGEFDRAAELTIRANALQLADLHNRGQVYDHQAHHAFIDQLTAAFSTRFFERVRGFGLETERPVFIVGLPRSGTSLTEQILASHPRVFGAGELKLAQQILETLRNSIGGRETPLISPEYLDRESTRHLAHHYLNELAAINDSADRVVDKMPDNTVYLGLIATLFPRAKLIHCRRDLRDVALSCWMTNFRDIRWACDPDQIASRIEEHERLMEHWRRVLPVPFLQVEYEAMVTDLEKWARAIVAWCGLEWDPACVEFHKTRRPVRTSSVAQVRQPLYTTSIGRWKNYQQSLTPLFAKLK